MSESKVSVGRWKKQIGVMTETDEKKQERERQDEIKRKTKGMEDENQ